MSRFRAALFAEMLKARRSRVPLFTALGFSLSPLMGGLFMVILKDPERARNMGLLRAKAQLVAGTADWPTFLGLLAQTVAVGGALVFAFVTAWVFGREFSDRTAKELLALPTSRATLVSAKFVVVAVWTALLTALVFGIGLGVGALVGLPGGTPEMLRGGAGRVAGSGLLTLMLMPLVALWASLGRGYLSGLGWGTLTLVLAQIVAATGWGGFFPWAVPALFSGAAGANPDGLGVHSYALVAVAGLAGLVGTYAWWQYADQPH